MKFEELIRPHLPRWPYPVRYGKEHEQGCDVLVLGGGIAGCWAAIGAARGGAGVILVEKAATKTSGAGGSGVDHWHGATMNPASKVSPEEMSRWAMDNVGGWRCGITMYIKFRDSYDCLLEMEKMGVKVRDSEDEFKGAPFRDDKSRLLFAYDYENRHTVRIWGAQVKQALYTECRRLGVAIMDHVMVTSLLSEGGRQGARVSGATGFNVRTGEFVIFKGKTTVLCMHQPQRQWIFSTELRGLSMGWRPPNLAGDGHAMAWRAGARLAGMEASTEGRGGPYGYPPYGVGNTSNTWHGCTMVDAKGKEVPWVDRDGRILTTVSERCRPATGQRLFFLPGTGSYPYKGAELLPDWPDRVRTGEFTLPLYADLPSMPEHERRALWGLMVAQEGKTLVPVYHAYSQAGFDPERDLLQHYNGGWFGTGPPQWRAFGAGGLGGGGLVVDWDLKTSLEGLYAAGEQVFVSGHHAMAATTGRHAGRRAARYALGALEPRIDRGQVEREKARVYAPIERSHGAMEWKELNAGVCRIMQDYCGAVRTEELLTIGLTWLAELETGEAGAASARNPHELMRLHEVFNIITNGRMIMEASRVRKASNDHLGFRRTDHPEVDPAEEQKWICISLEGEDVQKSELPLDYHGDLEENYQAHCLP